MSAIARRVLSLLAGLALAAGAFAQTYEAQLSPKLSSDPDMCAHAPCAEVLPGADSFSTRKGRPAYVEAYATRGGAKQLVGYVFLSTDIVDIPAYSGKPVVTLIGMDTKGIITGVKILKHSEPILLLGIPESKLLGFIGQYVGKSASDKIEVGRGRAEPGTTRIDAISGATVTVIAQNQVITRSAYEVARQVGLVKAQEKPAAKFTEIAGKLDWNALTKEGSVQRLTVEPRQIGEADTGQPHLDMHFGYLNAPNVGSNVLGAEAWRQLMAGLKPDEHAIFIVAQGTGSFKGSGFVRGGIFDRIQVIQGRDTFTFRDLDYLPFPGFAAPGAPEYRESGIFILRGGGFSGAYPWSLVYLASRVDQQTGARTFSGFEREYWLPARYLEGGRPAVQRPQAAWVAVWQAKQAEVIALVLFLAAVAGVYAVHDKLVRKATRKDKRWVTVPRYIIWVISVGFIGFYALAVPSITHVMTWLHAILFEWRWELFLSDPLIFIFWWFIIITVFIWGRGLFCGWLCPYGALAELAHKLAAALGLRRFQFNLPMRWHNKLKWVKYGIFGLLVAVSFYSIETAEKMAEVEPFKSTFLVGGFWSRAWPFVLYWVALFGVSLFIERPFCKYLCPLGAGLAIPTTFRAVPLKRKAECGNPCHACAKGCSALSIDKSGRIDQRECLLCLECQILYYDDHSCPPLSSERRRRSRAGLPLTPIAKDGYFIPIKEVR
ncbi:NosR/NirI family protein [Ramlibacter solisilvae]|nr:4Fe-4S binding protein [Ramlibacter tataouinensis]